MSDAFEKFDNLLSSTVGSLPQSFFDGFTKSNVETRARAGIEELIIREELGDCCEWCQDLAGTYTYGSEPKEVYGRHANCRCIVTHKSRKGTYQDVWSKREFKTYKEARIAREKEIVAEYIDPENHTLEYFRNGTPGKGMINRDPGYKVGKHKAEIEYAEIINKYFGGDIQLLTEVNDGQRKNPDYLWNGRLWDHKFASSVNSIDKQTQSGIHQIAKNPGGVIIALTDNSVSDKTAIRTVKERLKRKSYKETIDVILMRNKEVIYIIRSA